MMNKDIETIYNNYDNIGILNTVKQLLYAVINDVEYMNEDNKDLEELSELYLGNNTKIKTDDFETIVSFCDTLNQINEYNMEDMEL